MKLKKVQKYLNGGTSFFYCFLDTGSLFRESHGAPVIKLFLVAIYFTKYYWMRKGFYKIVLLRKIPKARG